MHAERERHVEAEKRQVERHRIDVTRAREDERRQLTMLIPKNDDDVTYPLGKPDSPIYEMFAKPWDRPMRFEPTTANLANMLAERYRFRITQHALRLPDGQSVVWFGLELCR